MAGNKVSLDMDMVGVTGSSYRIDTIDIVYRAIDQSLSATFILGKTPKKWADIYYVNIELMNQVLRYYRGER